MEKEKGQIYVTPSPPSQLQIAQCGERPSAQEKEKEVNIALDPNIVPTLVKPSARPIPGPDSRLVSLD